MGLENVLNWGLILKQAAAIRSYSQQEYALKLMRGQSLNDFSVKCPAI